MDKHHGVKIALDSLGCKLNQAEIELLARQLTEAGYRLVDPDGSPDVYILNTCTVTSIADRKSRHLLRLARRRNPHVRLVAIGCYAQRSARELTGIEGVDLVLGNEAKPDLLRRLQDSGCLGEPAKPGAARHSWDGRTRAFIKVQDGCTNFCSYCIVPTVRSKEESIPPDEVIRQVNQAVAGGYREVVLTGTKVGSYAASGANLTLLLERILAETNIERLRLSSVQPQELSPSLLGLWRNRRLFPHFHLSLQSGSQAVLQRMERRYSAAEYREAVSYIRKLVTDVAITTDVIVGFPGETEAEFQESYDFCAGMGFARIHVFPYSPRRGTKAARMSEQVSPPVKKARARKMLALAETSSLEFRSRFLGATQPVLWEKQANGTWSGLTPNYIKVYTKSTEALTNTVAATKIARVQEDGVLGTLEK